MSLQQKWAKCIELLGEYIEKWKIFFMISCFFLTQVDKLLNAPRISSHTHAVSMTAVISPVPGCSSVLLLVLVALSPLLVQHVLVTGWTAVSISLTRLSEAIYEVIKRESLMRRPPPSGSPWASVSDRMVWWVFMKFEVGVLYKKLLSKHKFHENQLRDSYTLCILLG